jgi:hypothetical protein
MSNKKSFDMARDSIYVADPSQLCIVGGKGVLPPDEAGDLDTEWEAGMPLNDLKRLKKPLEEPFKANIAHRGVNTPVIIAKINDVATVIAGKSRIRAARAANYARKKRGEPLIKVKCVMQRDVTHGALVATMVSENNARRDDDLSDKIEKLKTMLDSGISEEDAATHFAVKQTTIKGWLAYEDAATDLTKQAVKDGRVPASTAAELAKIKDPDEQNAALAQMIAAPEARGRSARAAKVVRRGKQGSKSASDRKSQQLLLSHVTGMSHGVRASEKSMAFWEGAEEMLKLVLGETCDERLVNALGKAREPKTA